MESDAMGITKDGLFFTLRYRYPGGHKWEHRFTTEHAARNWLQAFLTLVVDYQLTDPSGNMILESVPSLNERGGDHGNGS